MKTYAWRNSAKTPSRPQSPHIKSPKWIKLRLSYSSARAVQPKAVIPRADTVPIWETLVVLNGVPDALQSGDEQQELLDTLWSLQYRTPGACCASAGPVLQSASCNGSSAARAAVYYRFSSQTQAERFVAGPAFASAKERLLGSGTISLSLWKVLVPNDMEALFKRGPSFEAGVDLVLVLQPTAISQQQQEVTGPAVAAVPTDVVVEVVGRLQRTAMSAGSVQVSCGADVMSLDTRYVWMARFLHEGDAQRFLRSHVVMELGAGLGTGTAAAAAAASLPQGQGGALTITSLVLIEVGAVKQSKQGM